MRTLFVPALLCLLPIAAAAQTQPSPCSLVTRAEVQEAAGVPVKDGSINQTNKLICDYMAGDTGSMISVMLTAKGPADSAGKTAAELTKRKVTSAVVPGYGMQ